jgi:2,5-diketo-D-gluconate reductase B
MTTIDASMRALEIQGTTVPKLGFGTWQIEGPECQEAVEDALSIGYRHIDTARAYGNEREVGRGLAAAGVPRQEFFLTTKISREEHAPDVLRRAAEESLQNLQVDRLDLLLLHWPNPDFGLEETLGALVGLRDEGLIVHLGVSNFPAGMLREALRVAPVFADQVEFHPFLGQDALVELAAEKDFMVTAYSPLARGKVPADETLREIGEAHGKTAGQVALRWLLDKPQVCAIPKASSHERRVENFEVFDFELTDEERAAIEALPKDQREIDPGFGPDWGAQRRRRNSASMKRGASNTSP